MNAPSSDAPQTMQVYVNSFSDMAPASSRDPRYDIAGRWRDRDGWQAVMRVGYYDARKDRGFGLTKVSQKHGLTTHAALNASRYPYAGSKGKYRGGTSYTSYTYRTPIYKMVCSGWFIFRKCRVAEKRDVVTGIDYRSVGSGPLSTQSGPMGVITCYVEGYIYAPSWARNAIN